MCTPSHWFHNVFYTAVTLAAFTRIADAGVAVFTYDCMAHGKSDPQDDNERGVIWNFQDLVRIHNIHLYWQYQMTTIDCLSDVQR